MRQRQIKNLIKKIYLNNRKLMKKIIKQLKKRITKFKRNNSPQMSEVAMK